MIQRTFRTIGMQCLQLFAVVFACALAPDAGAQVCCPSGCVQNNNGCVRAGATQTSCPTVACQGTGSGNSGTGSTGSGTYVSPVQPGSFPQCFDGRAPQSRVDDATNKCVASLVANAQFVGCLFEDDAGRAEDKRTGMTCAARQAFLAKQCRNRCATFAGSTTRRVCNTEGFADEQWKTAFGDIGGTVVGSARVKDCGPPPKTVFSPAERARKVPSPFK